MDELIMKKFFLFMTVLFSIYYFYDAIKELKNEKLWTKEYNKLYSAKYPDKVELINDYYDCLKSSKSVIEGCEVHVAKDKVDILNINTYLTGLNKYVLIKKKSN